MPVKLPGLGTFTPVMNRQGEVRLHFRPEPALKKELNDLDKYGGTIRNKRRIKWDDAAYKELWDAEHPDDPLEI
jgi:hypothetical protein